jgi:hypothetical protein
LKGCAFASCSYSQQNNAKIVFVVKNSEPVFGGARMFIYFLFFYINSILLNKLKAIAPKASSLSKELLLKIYNIKLYKKIF